jgi:hypothetical protein
VQALRFAWVFLSFEEIMLAHYKKNKKTLTGKNFCCTMIEQ